MERKNQKLSALITTLLLCFSANAQVTYYSTDYGKDLGTSYTLGNTTFYNDAYGNTVNTATTLAPAPVYVPIQTIVPVAPNFVPIPPIQMPGLPALSLIPMWSTK